MRNGPKHAPVPARDPRGYAPQESPSHSYPDLHPKRVGLCVCQRCGQRGEDVDGGGSVWHSAVVGNVAERMSSKPHWNCYQLRHLFRPSAPELEVSTQVCLTRRVGMQR